MEEKQDESKVTKVTKLAEEKIKLAEEYKIKLNPLKKNVQGVAKLQRKIDAEIKFLVKSLQGGNLKGDHITCSNLNQLGAVVKVLTSVDNANAVLKGFESPNGKRLIVDVVGDKENTWFKVILRHPNALHHLFLVGGRKGVKSMKDIGKEFLATAQLHPVLFQLPKICFIFMQGISAPLANCLNKLGIAVKGQVFSLEELNIAEDPILNDSEDSDSYDDCSTEGDSSEDCFKEDDLSEEEEELSYQRVNLDVTAMIAYVSSTSNGASQFVFQDEFLREQAESERKTPVKPVIDNYFTGCELIASRGACDHFNEILNTIGGEKEKQRGQQLISRCRILPDQNCLQDFLKLGGRIKPLSLSIFSTGWAHKAPTVTSNRGFVRAAKNQGVNLPVLFHDPRALTEQKEQES